MKKIYFLITFSTLFFNNIVAQDPGGFYANLSGNFSLCNNGESRTLTADYRKLKPITVANPIDEYTFEQIPYNTQFSYTGGNEIPIPPANENQDDFFSPIFNLPFNFLFYGQFYNQLLVNSNGVLTFDVVNYQPGGAGFSWVLTNGGTPINIPDPAFPILNGIYGVYQDINFTVRPLPTTTINYILLDSGPYTAPNRVFVMNTNNVLLYPNAVPLQSYQIVLYESTNIIDINVKSRTQNFGWQGGAGVLGLQNADGTKASVPPNHNTGDIWNTTAGGPESWRFYPASVVPRLAPNTSVITWYKNNVPLPNTTDVITVNAVIGDVYKYKVTHTFFDGTTTFDISSPVKTFVNEQSNSLLNPVQEVVYFCQGDVINVVQDTAILNGLNPNAFIIEYYQSLAQVGSGNTIPPALLANYVPPTGQSFPQTIYISIFDFSGPGACPPIIRPIKIYVSPQSSGAFDYGTAPFCLGATTSRPVLTNTLTPGGSFVSSTLDVDLMTGEIRNFGSLLSGTYTVEYIFLPVLGCPPVPNATVVVNIASCGCAPENVGPICITSAFNLSAPILPGATQFIWTGPSDPPDIQNPTGIVIPSTAVGPYIYNLVIKDAAGLVLCTTTRTILISAPPSPPVVSTTSIPYCQGEAVLPLQAAGNPGSTILWYTDLIGGTGAANIPPVITTNSGTFLFYASQTVAGCESARATITVIVKPKPDAPIVATPNVNYCIGDTVQNLSSSVTNFSSLLGVKWYIPSGGGFLVSGLAPTPTTTNSGTKTYFVTQTIDGCESDQTAIIVTISASQPITSTTGLFNVCVGLSTLDLDTVALPSATNAWSTLDTAFATVNPITGVVTGVAAGTAIITFTNISGCKVDKTITVVASSIINGASSLCVGTGVSTSQLTLSPISLGTWSSDAASVATVSNTGLVTIVGSGTVIIKFVNPTGCEATKTITITAPPIISSPILGVFSVCISNTIDLNATNAPSVISTAWTSSDVAVATVNAISGIVTGESQGTVTIRFVDSNGCEDTQLITVNPIPIITETIAGSSSVCVGKSISLMSISAPATGNPWSISGGVSNASINSAGLLTGLLAGSVEVSYTGSNGCIGKKVITINSIPAAPSVAVLNYCKNEVVTTALTASGSGTLLWYANVTGGTSGAAPIPSTAIVGDKNYYVTQTVNGCESPRVALKVTINPTPTAPVVSSTVLQYCAGDTAVALSVISGNSNLLWYDSPTDLTGSTTPTIPSTSILGTTLYYVSQTVSGCESPKASLSVKINPIPNAPIVNPNPAPYCQGFTGATALTASGTGTLLWYTVATGGTGSNIAPTPSTLNAGNQQFYVSQTVNNCPSTRALITIEVNPVPNAPIVAAITYCKDQTVTQQLTAIATGALLWYANATGGIGGSAPIPSTALIGDKDYYVTQTVNGCTSARAKLTVSIVGAPNLVIVTPLIEKCAPAVINLTDPALTAPSQPGLLTYWNDAGATNSEISAQNASQISVSGIYYIKLTTNTCFTIKSVQVKINPLPIVTLDQNGFVCVDVMGATVAGSNYTLDTNFDTPQYSFAWFNNSVSTTIPIIGATNGSLTVNKSGTYTVKVTNQSTTCTNEATATIAASLPPNSISFSTSSYFADDKVITVSVNPPSIYEYQLNNGVFQDSNVFTGVNSGDNKVVVRDKFGCGEVQGLIKLLDFPKFFSPNGDGINDEWNIADIGNQNAAKIFIYDRYGKLLKQITPATNGWDGTFNTSNLPADDYWFTVDYQEDSINKIFKSHFALKR